MAIRKVKLIAAGQHARKRLDQILADWLPEALGRPISKSKVRKLIMAGAVHLNGRPLMSAAKALLPGATVEAYIDLAKLFDDSTARDREFELTADRILFEDEDLIVIDKPPGLPAHATLDKTRDNLVAAVSRFLSKRDELIDPYIGVHQRLDRDTSGVVLLTKSRRVNAAIAEVFLNHQEVKIYQALTVPRARSGLRRALEQEWTIKNYLGKVSSKSKRARYGAVKSAGDFAETSFRVIGAYRGGVWVEAIPRTGRTHQIRVHLSECGLPILGDDLYGAGKSDRLAPRVMLHAAQLTFPHPITGRKVSVKSPLPTDFQRCLERMRMH
jgi:23S rRNA pseudouridine1911/1915/1917 synthase